MGVPGTEKIKGGADKGPGSDINRKAPKKILVVDDDDVIRAVCAEVLQVAGFEVDGASDGFEALERLGESPYDVVITDVEMPGLDGISLFEQALKDHPYLKDRFIFMSGNTSEDMRTVVERTGAGFLAKPFKVMELIGAVDDLLARCIDAAFRWGETGKRREERFRCSTRCSLFDGASFSLKTLTARVLDISRSGIKLRYNGAPFIADSLVSLNMNMKDLSISRCARTIWSRKVAAEASESGLLFLEPVPVSSIINLSGCDV